MIYAGGAWRRRGRNTVLIRAKQCLLIVFAACMAIPAMAQETMDTNDPRFNDELIKPPEIYDRVFPNLSSIEDITGTVRLLHEGAYRPQGERKELTLKEAIGVAREYNPNMRISRSGLEQSKWQLEQVESGYRGLYDINSRMTENIRTYSGSGFRFDPNKGVVVDNGADTVNNELFRLGPTYSQQFKNGLQWQFNPSLELEHNSDGSFDRTASDNDGNDSDMRGAFDFSMSYPINSRTRVQIQRDLENAKLNTLQSDLDLYLQGKNVDNFVIRSYWNIKRLERELEIQNDRLLQAMQIEFIFRTQYEFENASRVQVGEAQIDVLNNQASLISQEGAYRSAVESFNLILGLPVETDLVLNDELKVEPLDVPAGEAVHMVTENNVELKNLRVSIKQQENSLRSAKLGQQPNLDLTSGYSINDEYDEGYSVGLIFNWPFGDGGATRARVRVLEESLKQLKIRLWNRERELVQETYDALRGINLQNERIMILERNVKQAEVNLDNALFTFKEFGKITFRDMQDTQIDLAQSRVSLVQSIVNYNIAKADLLQKIHNYQPQPEMEPLIDLLH
ncbi:MAG: hypothetical protein GC154_20280 [bacterium]|nr:hypothetical protein [bacterium]